MISQGEWDIFLRGVGLAAVEAKENPLPDLDSASAWRFCCYLEQALPFNLPQLHTTFRRIILTYGLILSNMRLHILLVYLQIWMND